MGAVIPALPAHLLPTPIIFDWASQLQGQQLLTSTFILRKVLKIVVTLKLLSPSITSACLGCILLGTEDKSNTAECSNLEQY